MGTRHETRSRRRNAEAGAPGFRGERLEWLIAEELNSILDGEATDPRLEGARITMVELSRDGSRARSWFAMPPGYSVDFREVDAAFDNAAGFFRRRLCEALLLKRIPELTFRHDPAASIHPEEAGWIEGAQEDR